jgi:cytochrome P450
MTTTSTISPTTHRMSERLTVAPGPKGTPIVGNTLAFVRDPRGTVMAWARQYGPLVRFQLGPMVVHLVADPEHVRQVLQTNSDNYYKAARMSFLTDFLGESLLTLEGRRWRQRRRLAQPAFHKDRLAEIADTMNAGARRLVARLESRADSGQAFDVHAEMMRLALGVAGEALFGVDLSTHADEVGRALPLILDHILGRMNALVPLPLWLPTPANRRYRAAVDRLDALVLGLLRDFRGGRVRPCGLLALLMAARDADTGQALTDEQLRDEVMTLILAGHETTAGALTWTWWLLAQHPDCAARLRAELSAVLGDRVPTAADLPRLQYARNTVYEAMRLMPPLWVIARTPIADDTIGGCHIPKGSMVLLAACATHRDPAHWDDPEAFDPDRFSPERSKGRHKLAYYPFSSGPRVCIGNNFAMMEATLVVAMMAQRFRLELDPTREVRIEPSMTLRPKHGLWMSLHTVARETVQPAPVGPPGEASANSGPVVAATRCPFASAGA